ncbi:MAG: carboxypeptidase-like regulatory domain-containing protein [Cytophagales bacterium]|nr:carboxypeptidase-like regulatory domain-containing protein [Cytophagales bacterium]
MKNPFTLSHPMRFKNTVLMSVILLLSGLDAKVLAQATTISGTVTSEQGEGIPGVAVSIEGTSSGTITDISGSFQLSVSSGDAVLIFSSVGYITQRVLVNNLPGIDITLIEDITALQEVVVTALGVERDKKALGCAVQEVEGAGLTKAREPNVMSSLTGRVVNNKTDLFNSPEFRLRGEIPLIVVDGVPNDSDFWDISPDDIEKITVLKGTTASALYGSIGKDGAIMITTKKGIQGSGTQVTFNSSTMFQRGFIAIPEVQSTYGT